MSKKNANLEIDWTTEPYSRKWNGYLGYHPYKNYVYGARCVDNTKADFVEKLEAFQRKMKALKKVNASR